MTGSRLGLSYQVLPDQLALTIRLLRDRGELGEEGYVVWVGEMAPVPAVREVWPVSADGDGAHAHVSFDDVLALAERVHARGWFILAQVHSHPFDAFHSIVDDRHPVSHQKGFISIVVPNFANGAALEGWSVNEHLGSGRWRVLERDEIVRRLVIGRPRKEVWWRKVWAVITAQRFSSRR